MAETEESAPQWFLRFQETNDRRLSRLEAMVADLLCRSKKENPEDQICNDEELTEIEAETKSSGIEDRAVENEANATVISATDKEEPIPQLQVPVSKLEPSLRFRNASPVVCEDFRSLVGFDGLFDHVKARAESVTKSTSVTNNQVTHQMFDEIPLRKGILPKEHKERFHKSWRFKFKHSVAPRDSKSVSDVLRTTLGPSSMLKMLLDADEEVGVGTTSVIVLAGELSQPIDVKDSATVLGVVKSCIGTKFISQFGDLIADLAIDATTTISVDLGQGLREVDISDLACHYFSNAGVSTSRRLRKTDNNRTAKECRAVIVNRPDELQESDVIICPLADHLKSGYVVFFTKEASRKLEQFSGLCKEQKDIDVSLASFYVWLRQTSFVVQQEEFEQVENHTPCSVIKWERPQDHDALLLPFPGDERFQIKHKWRFKLLLAILELELYLDSLVFITSYGHQFDIISLIILMSVELSVSSLQNQMDASSLQNLEVKVSSKEGDLLQVSGHGLVRFAAHLLSGGP